MRLHRRGVEKSQISQLKFFVFCLAAIFDFVKKMFTVGQNNLPDKSHASTDFEVNWVFSTVFR
jgi:hypothetical protein